MIGRYVQTEIEMRHGESFGMGTSPRIPMTCQFLDGFSSMYACLAYWLAPEDIVRDDEIFQSQVLSQVLA